MFIPVVSLNTLSKKMRMSRQLYIDELVNVGQTVDEFVGDCFSCVSDSRCETDVLCVKIHGL